jgi:hypothetical protein
MRRYDIVSGILLVLPIVDFALAAPILVQEKQRRASVDLVPRPKDVITVFGKRWMEGIDEDAADRFMREYFADLLHPAEAPGVQAPSIAQHPPLLEAGLYELYPWMRPSSSSTVPVPPPSPPQTGGLRVSFPNGQSTADLPEQHGTSNAIVDNGGSNNGDDMSHWSQHSPTSSGHDSDRALLDAHPPPQPNHPLPTTDSEMNFDRNNWMNPGHSSPPRPASATEPGHEVVTPPSTGHENPSSSTGS